jgi:hypothetical protein
MGTDPLFPTAAFLPLAPDASTARRSAGISFTKRGDFYETDDYTSYTNESEGL